MSEQKLKLKVKKAGRTTAEDLWCVVKHLLLAEVHSEETHQKAIRENIDPEGLEEAIARLRALRKYFIKRFGKRTKQEQIEVREHPLCATCEEDITPKGTPEDLIDKKDIVLQSKEYTSDNMYQIGLGIVSGVAVPSIVEIALKGRKVKQLANVKLSSLVGIISGGLALGYSMTQAGRLNPYRTAIMSYGFSALTTGVLYEIYNRLAMAKKTAYQYEEELPEVPVYELEKSEVTIPEVEEIVTV